MKEVGPLVECVRIRSLSLAPFFRDVFWSHNSPNSLANCGNYKQSLADAFKCDGPPSVTYLLQQRWKKLFLHLHTFMNGRAPYGREAGRI